MSIISRLKHLIWGHDVNKRVPLQEPVSPPPDFDPVHDISDDVSGYEPEVDDFVPVTFDIEYLDAKGARTARRITLIRTGETQAGIQTIMAFCHWRKALRTFRVNRIACCVDPLTGEVRSAGEYLRIFSQSRAPIADHVLGRFVTALVYMSFCDGSEHPSEWAAIEAAITGYALRYDGTDETVAQGMAMARRINPSTNDFAVALHALSQARDVRGLAQLTLYHCGRVVEADGLIRSIEMRELQKVQHFLANLAQAA